MYGSVFDDDLLKHGRREGNFTFGSFSAGRSIERPLPVVPNGPATLFSSLHVADGSSESQINRAPIKSSLQSVSQSTIVSPSTHSRSLNFTVETPQLITSSTTSQESLSNHQHYSFSKKRWIVPSEDECSAASLSTNDIPQNQPCHSYVSQSS